LISNSLIFLAISDLAGKTRGKSFPAVDLDKRLKTGLGWTPTNVQITCFDTIATSPFGALGDLILQPDANAEIHVDFEDGAAPERFILCDITSLDGKPWNFCTRTLLKTALARLKLACGATLLGAFEHEFQLAGEHPTLNEAYGLTGFSQRRTFGETLVAALKSAGLAPETFMKEYGQEQFEVTIGPERAVDVADAAIIVRELTRATARRLGEKATFTPIRDVSGVGNGVHVHMSFVDDRGEPLTYDPNGPGGMSALTASFAAGVLKYIGAIVALTAPSAISYQRLTPHRWSAAFNNLGLRDREALLRICPFTATDEKDIARQFNIEYRAADAAASPYLALAAIIHAGAQGIEDALPAPTITEEDLSLLTPEELSARGYTRLPRSLEEALDTMNASETVCGWFPEGFAELYTAHKQSELAFVADLDISQKCAAYEGTY